MKSFLKTTLAVVCGILLTGIILSILTSIFIGAAISAGSSSTPVAIKNAVLKIDMGKIVLAEQSQEAMPTFSIGSSFSMDQPDVVGLWDAVCAINAAAEDPEVKFIYLKTDGLSGGMASIQELRIALENFRSRGKSVVSYLESPTTGSYYLASVSDKIYMTPYLGASSMMNGISGQLIFVKDLLDKFGVNMQLIRHGKYKSAGEMFIRSNASPENLEQNKVMINSIWNSYAEKIASSRGISLEAFNALIDDLALCEPEDFVKASLVDELLDKTAMENKLADLAVVSSFKEVNLVPFVDYVNSKVKNVPSRVADKIAIIYADGEIVDGDEKTEVAGDRFASEIAKVRADSTVKVVVLRVNSPGGSVLASEKIKRELDLLQKDKPIVASYGDYAASGGYWISNAADKIYSDAATLTGSIGVFGLVPDFSKTLKDVAHVNVTPVNSHKHSDMYRCMRPFDAQELAYMQRSIETIYTSFVNYVAQGRDMTPEAVDEIAQGRVWTGADAIKIGLVDEIGTLEDAVKYAASLAGESDLNKWKIVGYPKPLSTYEQLLEAFGEDNTKEGVMMRKVKALSRPQVQARMPFQFFVY